MLAELMTQQPMPIIAVPAMTSGSKPAMRKLSRSQMSSYRARVHGEQRGLCPLCGNLIDLKIEREGAIDHNHDTGEIRGILHRSCNGMEGKVFNAISRWGGARGNTEAVKDRLRRLLAYYEAPGTGFIYPLHKSPDDLRVQRNARQREQRAAKAAQRKMRGTK